MAALDIFRNNAFSCLSMTTALNNVPFQPSLLRNLGLFVPRPVRTPVVAVEERNGVLSVIQTSERGAPLEPANKDKRTLRDFRTRRIAKSTRIMADEIAGIRAFGSETELVQVVDEVNRRANGPTGLVRDVELTWERMALGAAQGIVLDADGSTIYDFYSEFGITAATEIDFDLDNAAPASGAVKKKCTQVARQMMRAANGGWVEGRTGVLGLCGDAFWDDLTAHTEVRQTYLNTQQAADLREGVAFESFRYGGITWVNYHGTDDNSTVAIHTDKAKFLPINGNGVFEVAYAPLETFDYVNTPGLPVYGLTVPDEKRNAFVDVEVYSYPLFMCLRPGMLQSARRT